MAADKKDFIQGAIKRPGALTARAKRNGRTVIAQARQDVKSGTTLEKQQGNFFLNTLRPGAAKVKRNAAKRRRRSLIK